MAKKRFEFAICVSNEGYDDLEESKIYRVLPDDRAADVGCIRVIDESGEDYLYPESRFAMVDLPKAVRARLPIAGRITAARKSLRANARNRRRLSA